MNLFGDKKDPTGDAPDLTRRRMLMRLGLGASAVYAAPVLLRLTEARASKGSGGGSGGSGGGSGGSGGSGGGSGGRGGSGGGSSGRSGSGGGTRFTFWK